MWPTPPPHSRRHGHPRRVRRHHAHRRRVRRGRRHHVLRRRVHRLHDPVLVVLVLLAVALSFVIARRSSSPSPRPRQSGGKLGGRAFVRAPDQGEGGFSRACTARAGQGARQRSEPAGRGDRGPGDRALARRPWLRRPWAMQPWARRPCARPGSHAADPGDLVRSGTYIRLIWCLIGLIRLICA